ncbi:MAG: hypothetical protein NTU73_10355 [Ignavibacteriae bacterium]|nr:hypothetical protein [Ignavibacteriota bacterium]
MRKNLIIYFLFFVLFSSCENIFAPKIDNTTSSPIITDQTTTDGVFQNFKYSYTFKDTSVYSNLFTDDFIFTYRDYALGYDVSWDKPTELKTTGGLFQNSQKLEIIWNNIILQTGDSLNQKIKRSFNLTITFNPSNVVRLNGFADMSLIKNTNDSKWRIYMWKDESF